MNTCPPRDRWEAFLQGDVTPTEDATMTAHHDGCLDCQKLVAELAAASGREGDPSAPRPVFLNKIRDLRAAAALPPTTTWDGVPGLFPPAPSLDDFAIEGEPMRGGMGIVYKARDRQLNRAVAIKVLKRGRATSSQRLALFRAEAETVAQLQHPHIVPVFAFGERDGQPYLVMEFVAGGSLAGRVRGQPQPPTHAARIVALLARAVHAAHQKNILHLDLKPQNVLLAEPADQAELNSPYGCPKVTDFGLARRMGSADADEESAIAGTPSYMAPEQAEGRVRDLGPTTDVYGLGAILYELLAGRPPFLGTRADEIVRQVATASPLPVRQVAPKCPKELAQICMRCLAKETTHRYPSAAELGEALERFQARGRRRKRLASLAAIVGILILVIVGSWQWVRLSGEQERAAVEALHNTTEQLLARFDIEAHASLASFKHDLQSLAKGFEDYLRRRPSHTSPRTDLARVYQALAWIAAANMDFESARTYLVKARSILAKLAEEQPSEPSHRDYLATCLNDLGIVAELTGDFDTAESHCREAIEVRQAVLADAPDRLLTQRFLIGDWRTLSLILEHKGNWNEALAAEMASERVARDRLANPEDKAISLSCIAGSLCWKGYILAAQGKNDEAEAEYKKAIESSCEVFDRVAEEAFLGNDQTHPFRPHWINSGLNSFAHYLGLTSERAAWGKAISYWQRAVVERRGEIDSQLALARSQMTLSYTKSTQRKMSHIDECTEAFQVAQRTYEDLIRSHPEKSELRAEAIRWRAVFGNVLVVRGLQEMAKEECAKAERELQEVFGDRQSLPCRRLMASSHCYLGILRMRLRQAVPTLRHLMSAQTLDSRWTPVFSEILPVSIADARRHVVEQLRGAPADDAVREAEALVAIPGLPGEALYDAACVFATTSPAAKEPAERERRAAKAVALLRQAFATGFAKDPIQAKSGLLGDPVVWMRDDKDLAPIRDRDDFKVFDAALTPKVEKAERP